MSHLGQAENVRVEWDEGGCSLLVTTSYDDFSFSVTDPAQLLAVVQAEIGPWVAEMESARREFDRAVAQDEPAEPDWDAVRDAERGK